MTVRETLLIDVTCDIHGCSHSIACGNSFTFAEENGWKLSVPIDDTHKDFCPECYGDLKAFTDGSGEDEELINAMNTLDEMAQEPPEMNLHDVLAGEQKRAEYDE